MSRLLGVGVLLLTAAAFVVAMSNAACTSLDDLAGVNAPAGCDGGNCAPDSGGETPPIIIPDGGTCPDGTQDNDGDHGCLPTCAVAAAGLNCVHARCDDSKGKAQCVCAPGYALEADKCVWKGTNLLDPGFQKQPPTAWTTIGAATIDPVVGAPTGVIDPGAAQLKGLTACTLADAVQQTIQMPTVAEGEAFAIEVNGANPDGDLVPQMRVNGIWIGSMFLYNPKPPRFCLGERAYGKDVLLAITGDNYDSGCSDTTVASIDHVAIVSAADCPPPAMIVNGDFEGTGNWTATTGADVANGVGSSGSRGGHVVTTTKCTQPSLTGKFSTPWKSLDRPALSFTYKGTTGQKMFLGTNTTNDIGEVRGTNTFQAARFCLHDYMKGVTTPLRFTLPYRQPANGGACTDLDPRDFVFDDLAFVSDPTCPAVPTIFNGDFETTGVTQPWALFANDANTPTPSILSNPSVAHAGNGVLQVVAQYFCGSVTATQWVTSPASSGAAGPALKFWYKLTQPATPKGAFYVLGTSLVTSPTWTQKTVCLDPNSAGRGMPVSFQANGQYAQTCGGFLDTGAEILYVDDVEVTTDATCPSK